MKSLARDGDSDVGCVRRADPSTASGVTGSAGCWLVLMTQTLRPATDSERHTIDDRPRTLHHAERATHDVTIGTKGTRERGRHER
ncbi:hypothetical protein GCM10010381_19860 [Streptomyces xantholiticus]|nr:hypothetical protein GCM10010381_19860 [Streptomyces xantholiticus]